MQQNLTNKEKLYTLDTKYYQKYNASLSPNNKIM